MNLGEGIAVTPFLDALGSRVLERKMSLLIDQPEADKLIQELISYTGESAPEAITRALQERLEREKNRRIQYQGLAEQILQIGRECASLPVLDDRPVDEILGYNEQGFLQ